MTETAGLGEDAALGPRHRELPILALPVEHDHGEGASVGELDLYFICGVVLEPS